MTLAVTELVGFAASLGDGVYNYFGTGADGDETIGSNTTLATSTGVDDSGFIVKNYNTLTINAGYTLSPANRTKFMLLYVLGDCTINGTISVSAMGSAAVPSEDIHLFRKLIGGQPASITEDSPSSIYTQEEMKGRTGTRGKFGADQTGAGPDDAMNLDPAEDAPSGAANQTGSGGGGGFSGNQGGTGHAGSAYSGGNGGGGGSHSHNGNNATSGAGGVGADCSGVNFGAGGGGAGHTGGGGGAASSGDAQPGSAGSNGSGGVLILIVGGNLTFGGSSTITANGTNGGDGGYGSGRRGGGGGGSGGGLVHVLYGGTLTNSGVSITANGGIGGNGNTNPNTGGRDGANGGAGDVQGPTKIFNASNL